MQSSPSTLMQRLRLQRTQQKDAAGTQLFYLLDAKAGCLQIECVLARHEPGGQLTNVQSYVVQTAHLHQPPSFISSVDLPVLTWLREQTESSESQRRIIEHWQRSDLDGLFATARVRCAEHQHRSVTLVAQADLPWCWQEQEDGSQRGELVWPGGVTRLANSGLGWQADLPALHLFQRTLPLPLSEWARSGLELSADAVADFVVQYQHLFVAANWQAPIPRPIHALPVHCQPWLHFTRYQGEDVVRLGYCYSAQASTSAVSAEWFFSALADTPRSCFKLADGAVYQCVTDGVAEQTILRTYQERLARAGGRQHVAGLWRLPSKKEWQSLMTRDLPVWQTEGAKVQVDEGFEQHWVLAGQVVAEVDNAETGWFDLAPRIWLGEEAWDFLPLLRNAAQQYSLSALQGLPEDEWVELGLPDGRRVLIEARRLQRWLGVWIELLDGDASQTRLHLPEIQVSRLAQLIDDDCERSGLQDVWALAEQQVTRPSSVDFALPEGFIATLRPYQRQGVAWLQHLASHGLGGILADDMGLGKTLQTLALISLEKHCGRLALPALVVVPTSLLSNWAQEAARFAPGLRCAVVHGAGREKHFNALDRQDLLITSYGTLLSDQLFWQTQALSLLILDEAQTIRNASTRISACVKSLQATQRICLTGTPVENHLAELWSLFDFVLPGFLGNQKQFKHHYFPIGHPQEPANQNPRLPLLLERVAPFMFRRRKSEVASELPPKTEVVVRIPLQEAQSELYETLRARFVEQLAAGAEEGEAMLVLNVLTRLRQVCCDPALLGDAGLDIQAQPVGSAKRDYLLGMLDELVDEGRAVLVFSQFTRMLELIASDLQQRGIPYLQLTGKSRDRQTLVERFQAGEVPVFLISLKAGGTGLNLTRADTVIHYDPWWNSAAVQQASDRAHRIGQKRQVFIYKLIAEQTVEEKILALQANKQGLLDALNDTAEHTATQWSKKLIQLRDLVVD